MSKINWILNSTLISKPELRDKFLIFLKKKFIINNQKNSLNDLPLRRFFDRVGDFKIEICNYILEAKVYLFFEHNANDETLQKLIFLFLRYTQHKYPDLNSWEAFSYKTRESQREEIVSEIQMMWLDMQSGNITDEIINDLN
jgi:hypothetical protein